MLEGAWHQRIVGGAGCSCLYRTGTGRGGFKSSNHTTGRKVSDDVSFYERSHQGGSSIPECDSMLKFDLSPFSCFCWKKPSGSTSQIFPFCLLLSLQQSRVRPDTINHAT